MRGLLYKDWSLVINSYKYNFLLLLVFYALLTALLKMTFLAYAMVFVVGMYAASTTSMDENSHWDAYARTLPVTPGQLVAVKYLLTLFFTAVGVILSFVLLQLVPQGVSTLAEEVLGLSSATLVTMLYFSLTIPLSYRFGAVRARSWVTVALLLVDRGPGQPCCWRCRSRPGDGWKAPWGALSAQVSAGSLTEAQFCFCGRRGHARALRRLSGDQLGRQRAESTAKKGSDAKKKGDRPTGDSPPFACHFTASRRCAARRSSPSASGLKAAS